MAIFDQSMFNPQSYAGGMSGWLQQALQSGLLGRAIQPQQPPMQPQTGPTYAQGNQGMMGGVPFPIAPGPDQYAQQQTQLPPNAQPAGPAMPQQTPQTPQLFGGGIAGKLQNALAPLNPQAAQITMSRQLMQAQLNALMQTPGMTAGRAMAMLQNPALQTQYYGATKLAPGEQLVPNAPAFGGQGGQTGASNTTGIFDKNTLTTMADQYLAGDKSVLQNLGRSSLGALNVTALRQRIAERMGEKGISPEEQAVKMAEYTGLTSAQTTLGNRIATIGMAGTEANQLAPLVIQASAAVNRSQFPTLNKVLLAGEKGIGDPKVVQLGISVNSLINAYARAINPFGTSTVSDKDHARELLSDAWSHGQIQSGVAQLQKEIDAARKSPGIVKEELRKQYGNMPAGQHGNNDPLGIR